MEEERDREKGGEERWRVRRGERDSERQDLMEMKGRQRNTGKRNRSRKRMLRNSKPT